MTMLLFLMFLSLCIAWLAFATVAPHAGLMVGFIVACIAFVVMLGFLAWAAEGK
jgi:hypothetical protein